MFRFLVAPLGKGKQSAGELTGTLLQGRAGLGRSGGGTLTTPDGTGRQPTHRFRSQDPRREETMKEEASRDDSVTSSVTSFIRSSSPLMELNAEQQRHFLFRGEETLRRMRILGSSRKKTEGGAG
ncbi:hypothetical protein MTO96_004661 [Rhipicephalus appendiculatus]